MWTDRPFHRIVNIGSSSQFMSFLSKFFARENPNAVMRSLYDAIVGEGRQIHWYDKGEVPDTLDGRFDMITAILCLIMFRLEANDETRQETAWLTELFVRDMDGQLRQIGIGDMIVGKHIGRMMGALGGRLGAYRSALTGDADLQQALVRNLYRGEAPQASALEHVSSQLENFHARLKLLTVEDILAGQIPGAAA